MIDNAQLIYAEIRQLQETALKHRRNHEFWTTLCEAHVAERAGYKASKDMWSYWVNLWYIRRMLKKNKKRWYQARDRAENLRYTYKRLTGKGANADDT